MTESNKELSLSDSDGAFGLHPEPEPRQEPSKNNKTVGLVVSYLAGTRTKRGVLVFNLSLAQVMKTMGYSHVGHDSDTDVRGLVSVVFTKNDSHIGLMEAENLTKLLQQKLKEPTIQIDSIALHS